jgi:hypothetical protein
VSDVLQLGLEGIAADTFIRELSAHMYCIRITRDPTGLRDGTLQCAPNGVPILYDTSEEAIGIAEFTARITPGFACEVRQYRPRMSAIIDFGDQCGAVVYRTAPSPVRST